MSTPAPQQPLQFTFATQAVRVELDEHGEPWFCAPDVCDVLGYTNSRKALADHCRASGVTKRDTGVVTGKKADGTDATQTVPLTFINEGNLFRLILKSRKPQAQQFEDVVCDEILPQIRKTGRFQAQPAPSSALGETAAWLMTQYTNHISRNLYRNNNSVSNQLRQAVIERFGFPPREVPAGRLNELVAFLEQNAAESYQLWSVCNQLERMLMQRWRDQPDALPQAVSDMMQAVDVPNGPETATAKIRASVHMMLPGATP